MTERSRLAAGALVLAGLVGAGCGSTSPGSSTATTVSPGTTVAPSTTAPSTTAPLTTAPSTTAPSTTAPSTTAPSTTAPSTTAPSTTAPSSTAPPVTPGGGGTLTVHVWFLNEHHAATGQSPLFEPVDRTVQTPAVAGGALDALFAGPTLAERTDGLRLVTSGATGYAHLHIDNGVAYVTLTGTCSSGGSTMTVASEIMPTLKQFSSVDHVKIFAADGTTETPTGAVDSIPFCLEP